MRELQFAQNQYDQNSYVLLSYEHENPKFIRLHSAMINHQSIIQPILLLNHQAMIPQQHKSFHESETIKHAEIII